MDTRTKSWYDEFVGIMRRVSNPEHSRTALEGFVAKPLSTAFLFSLILAAPAAAQTTATTGGVAGTTLANPYGAVTLRGTAAAPATAAAAPSSAASGAASAGGSGNGAGAGPGASVPAAAPASGRSSATGTAARSTSNNVPDWLLCPPLGATGMAPLVTGTGLSCAP